MNNKLPRFLKPSLRLYFIFLILFAVSTYFLGEYSKLLAAAEMLIVIILVLYSIVAAKTRDIKLRDYIDSVAHGVGSAARENPLPVAIFSTESGALLWANEKFLSITGGKKHFFEVSITDAVPDFSMNWLMEGNSESPGFYTIGDKQYKAFGSITRGGEGRGFEFNGLIATTFWVDMSELSRLTDEYTKSQPVCSIIVLDNYEELLKGLSEKEKSSLLSDIDEKITLWSEGTGGFLCKYDRDRYFFLFEERSLEGFIEDKFSLLDSVRAEVGGGGVHATLSIGLGKDGETPQENFRHAGLGVEMALSRGGDQAVIRNRFGFEFFGGHSAQLEKRTKVKSRVMANAFGELISDASTIFIMGHKAADYDTIGAAVGVCCIARAKKKNAYIVVDMENNHSENLIQRLQQTSEYKERFISAQDAIIAADSKSLLVVVDTSRPEKVESETLLLSCTRVAVIDHHRRAATYIDSALFKFHEPYASSACELVTEMIQYLVDSPSIHRIEAEALLSGIVLDTKSFAIHTGSRTFDAAAFLRRAGADTTDVKRLMQADIDTATSRFSLMRGAKLYHGEIALVSSDEEQNRLSIAQAADELLNVAGVSASFVAARDKNQIFISGRSIGFINVQVILEKLGGGGNQATAGVQIDGTDVEKALADLKEAIDMFIENDAPRQTFDRR